MYARKSQPLAVRLMLLMGIVAAALRFVLLGSLDARKLIPGGHPLSIALWVLTAIALGFGLYHSLRLSEIETYEGNFPKSLPAFLGNYVAAVGILLTVMVTPVMVGGTIKTAWTALGFASVLCLMAAGWLRLQGKQPFFLLHLIPTAFLVAHTVSQYQIWSIDPQLLSDAFSLFGIVGMVFFAFYHSAFDVGLIWRKKLDFCALISVYLGTGALAGSGYPWLYGGVAVWALLDHPAPAPRRCPTKEETE